MKIYLCLRCENNFVTTLDLARCQRDIDTMISVASSWVLKLNACAVMSGVL